MNSSLLVPYLCRHDIGVESTGHGQSLLGNLTKLPKSIEKVKTDAWFLKSKQNLGWSPNLGINFFFVKDIYIRKSATNSNSCRTFYYWSHPSWRLLEQYRDKKRGLQMVFIDLEKTCDKVHIEGPLEMFGVQRCTCS